MTNLFQLGTFRSSAGIDLPWKIACDALGDADWECLAAMLAKCVGPFSFALGVPLGGAKLAYALHRHRLSGAGTMLLVDDVLTTGTSMERMRAMFDASVKVRGAVVFARGKCPEWITPLFRME